MNKKSPTISKERKEHNKAAGEYLGKQAKLKAYQNSKITALIQSIEKDGFKSLPDLLKFLQNLDYLAMQALVKGLKSPRIKDKMEAFKEWKYLRFELPAKLQFQQGLSDTLTRLSVMELEKIAHVRTMEEKRELLADYEVLE